MCMPSQYYSRYANHENSIKLEHELFLRMERKMQEIQEHSSLSWIEVQFLAKAVETLTRCRTVLKWTYAMAFCESARGRAERGPF